MQDAEEADLGAKMLRIGGDFNEGFGYRTEQQVVQFAFILPDEIGQIVRQTEHDMEVTGGQEFLLSGCDPSLACLRLTLGAMSVPARVKGEAPVLIATWTHIDMAAKNSRAASHDGLHHLELLETHAVAMTIDEALALRAKDVGHLHGGPVHSPFLGRRLGLSPSPEIGRVSTGLLTDCR